MTIRTPRVVQDDKHWLDPPWWWKQYKPLRIAAVLVIVGGFGTMFWSGASLMMTPEVHPETAKYMAVEANRVALAGVFRSYDSVAVATAAIEKAAAVWTQSKNHRPVSERYPPRNLDTVQSEPFEVLGQPGKLTLEFINDRLYEVYFEPKDADAFSNALHAAVSGLKRDRTGGAERTQGFQRVVSNVDLVASPVGRALGTRPYVIWQDTRLVQQRDEWDAAYGSIPVPAQRD